MTEPGVKAQKMNAFFNEKTAEKALEFGEGKCKSILVGTNIKKYHQLQIDGKQWTVEYEESEQTGKYKLSEKNLGATDIMKTKEQKYPGFVLSSTGDNMADREIKKKSIGTVKSTLKNLPV